jgi:hypothetical protein
VGPGGPWCAGGARPAWPRLQRHAHAPGHRGCAQAGGATASESDVGGASGYGEASDTDGRPLGQRDGMPPAGVSR